MDQPAFEAIPETCLCFCEDFPMRRDAIKLVLPWMSFHDGEILGFIPSIFAMLGRSRR